MAKTKKKPNPTSHTVTMTAGIAGITYLPAQTNKKVRSKDLLQWTCNKDFAIHFENNISPFYPNLPSLSARAGQFTPFKTIKTVNAFTPHKYFVAAYVGGSSPIVTDDPQIIIDDTPGGGGDEPAKKRKPTGKQSTKKKAAKKKTAKK